jgi:uncharacterized protein (DUF1800 family)
MTVVLKAAQSPAKKKTMKKVVAKKPVAKTKKVCRLVTKKVRGKKRRVKVCHTVKVPTKTTAAKKTPTTSAKPVTTKPVAAAKPTPAKPLTTSAAAGGSSPPAPTRVPVPTFGKALGEAQIERLLWRAGFGPKPGQAAQMAGTGLTAAVLSLTRPSGPATLIGPEPHDDDGLALAPADVAGHDHLSWLDRMIRSDQPLVERMALVWHDWFATSTTDVGSQQQMLDQIQLFRDKGLGSFDDLFLSVTQDPAMLVFLNGNQNTRTNPNENYAREMMELFSLGADRGAYSETDVREMARALTGWRSDWSATEGNHNFRYDATRHDATSKTVFGQTGNFDWTDAVRLCVTHPLHASFFCAKLWSYFMPTAPDDATLASLQGVYLGSGRQIRPVVEAILQHPDFHAGADMVIPPVVWTAGLLRSIGRGVDTTAWVWLASGTGQRLFYPPNVAGWDDTRWLDTSTARGRWLVAHYATQKLAVDPWGTERYDANEDAAAAVTAAMDVMGHPSMSLETQQVIADFANSCLPSTTSWNTRAAHCAMRQNALRMLIATSPDLSVC